MRKVRKISRKINKKISEYEPQYISTKLLERNKVSKILRKSITPPMKVPVFSRKIVKDKRGIKYRQVLKNKDDEIVMQDLPLVAYNNVLMVGLMGSGKSKLMNRLIDMVRASYPPEEINIQFTDSMLYNIDHLEDVFYNMLICDDAVELQDSYESIGKKSKALSHKVFKIRHLVEDRFHRESGFILTVWGVQMYKALQKRLRQAPITFYTSVFNDREENKFLKAVLGYPHFEFLTKKTDLVYLNNIYDYNRYCVLKANDMPYFYEFDLPKSKLKRKSTILEPKGDRELELLKQLINNGMSRAKAYAIFAYINNPDRKPRVNKIESQMIRDCKVFKFNISLLAEAFKRSTATISLHLDKGKKKGEK